jgi:glycosyltransferase involved in cell wall biosynthesis
MRIALTADPEIPVPPILYGGIERMIHGIAAGLVERGHDVTLFAHRASRAPCEIKPYPAENSRGMSDVLRNAWHVSTNVLGKGFDIVHSFGRLAYLAPILAARVPVLMSYQRPVTESRVRWATRLSGGRIGFAAVSRYHLAGAPVAFGRWFVVYNGVSENAYQFRQDIRDEAPLVFLGRMESIKGPHLAIEVAKKSGRHLVLAGNLSPGTQHEHYFATQVRPFVDGDQIQYVGPLDDAGKNELLGAGYAFLMPILWDELFGIVMAEALACGLPIIGMRRGAVPEIVEEGVNGFVCDSVDEMIAAVARIPSIDRRDCRRILEERFSERAMIEGYVTAYRELVDAAPSSGSVRTPYVGTTETHRP